LRPSGLQPSVITNCATTYLYTKLIRNEEQLRLDSKHFWSYLQISSKLSLEEEEEEEEEEEKKVVIRAW
jgi:hypothetical protein